MSMFTLAISCLTTSNLPWFMDLTFQVPMQYCYLQHRTLISPPDTSTAGHNFCFCLASSFFLELFICSSPVTFWHLLTWGFIFQCPIFLPFHAVHGVLKARILKWFAIPFSSGPRFCQNFPPWPVHVGWPYTTWLSFIELDQAVVHVTSTTLKAQTSPIQFLKLLCICCFLKNTRQRGSLCQKEAYLRETKKCSSLLQRPVLLII